MPVAIVTGASSGIGQSAAIRIAERGVGVILTYHHNAAGAEDTVDLITRAGGKAVALALDVRRSETFPGFRAAVIDVLDKTWQTDKIDYLVNNAGFGQSAMFEDTSEELFDDFMRTILKGPYFLTQALLPLFNDGGAIVNITSNSALPSSVSPGYSAYASMKGALAVLTTYLAKELGPRRIRVNAVAPGPTRTRIGGDAFEKFPEVITPLVERTTLGRLGEPDDVGMAIAGLVGDESRWITAQHIEVSGGFNL